MQIRNRIKLILEAMRIDDKGNLVFDEAEESLDITVQQPNLHYSYTFKVQGAFKVGKDLFLLGFHGGNQEMTMLGFELSASLRTNIGYVYSIQQQSEGYYKKALKVPVGKAYPIYCDISLGVWTAINGVKVDLQALFTLIHSFDTFKEITKTPDGYLF